MSRFARRGGGTAAGAVLSCHSAVHRNAFVFSGSLLIKKGLVCAPEHGHVAYPVPRTVDFLSRRPSD